MRASRLPCRGRSLWTSTRRAGLASSDACSPQAEAGIDPLCRRSSIPVVSRSAGHALATTPKAAVTTNGGTWLRTVDTTIFRQARVIELSWEVLRSGPVGDAVHRGVSLALCPVPAGFGHGPGAVACMSRSYPAEPAHAPQRSVAPPVVPRTITSPVEPSGSHEPRPGLRHLHGACRPARTRRAPTVQLTVRARGCV